MRHEIYSEFFEQSVTKMLDHYRLTWDKVHISDEDIANDDSHLWIEQELARVSKEARQQLDDKEIMFIFPSIMSNTHTNLVLKKPKTESSIRKVWIPKTVAYILREWRQIQDQYKEYLAHDYFDYNLVLTLPNGRPVENRIMEKEFSKLREKAGLPYAYSIPCITPAPLIS